MAPSNWVVVEVVSIVVEEETSTDVELALQGLAVELDTRQLAIKAMINVLGFIFLKRINNFGNGSVNFEARKSNITKLSGDSSF